MATETRSRFNNVITPGLFMIAVSNFKRYADPWRNLFTVKKSKNAYEEIGYMSGLGALVEKPEGTGITYDARIQGPTKKWVHKTWALGVRITQELIDDDRYNVMESLAAELGKSAAETVNIIAFDMLNSTTKTSADGQVVFYDSHVRLDGSTYDNLCSAASLSLDSLETDIAQYESLQDHRGKYINRKGSCRMVVANSALEWDLAKLFHSTDNPTTANRAINEFKDARPKLSYYTTPYITDTNARYYLGEKDPARGPIYFTRKPAVFAREGDFDTGDALFKVSLRNSVEVADPMNIFKNAGA